METPPTGRIQSNYPRRQVLDDGQTLRNIASAQKLVGISVCVELALILINVLGLFTHFAAFNMVVLFASVPFLVFTIYAVVKLSTALSKSPFLFIFLMFVPCASLMVLGMLFQTATKHLKAAGIKVGLFGVDPTLI